MKKSEKKMREIIAHMMEIKNEEELEAVLEGIRSGQYKYIIPFDMGCGNSSGAVSSRNNQEPRLIQWLYFDRNDKGEIVKIKGLSIPTIFGYDDDEPVIGPEAMMYGEAVENFKAVPNDEILDTTIFAQVGNFTDVPLRRVWKRYFAKAFEIALETAQEMYPDINKNNVIFVVAHPSDEIWEENLDSYKKLIMDGTGLKKSQVITFSEAKASMQYVRVEKRLKLDWKKGVIVIDLGASTIDIEYLAYNKEQKEYSITMAGRDVDRLLGHEILKQLYPNELSQLEPDELPDDDFFEAHKDELGVSRRTFSWLTRNIKEVISTLKESQFFTYRTPDGRTEKLGCDHILLEHVLATVPFSFDCSDPHIAAFINGQKDNEKVRQSVCGTWYQYLEQLVCYVLQQIGEDGDYVDKIIVTGGTANLIGVNEHIKQGVRQAGWPEIETIVLNQPADYERTVPYGSAYYLMNVINNMETILNFPQALQEALKKDIVSDSAKIIREYVAPVVEKRVQDKIDSWADLPRGDSQSSVNVLKNTINNLWIPAYELQTAAAKAAGEINRSTTVDQLPETRKKINEFLDALSMTKTYNYSVDISGVQCMMDTEQIAKAASYSFSSLSFTELISGFWNSLAYIFTDDDKPLRPSARQSVADNFRSKNTIYADLLKPITEEFSTMFDKQEGFGIVECIVEKLEKDINQAMFIGG